jgi:peptidoglycan/xylan/chitin deacetylase (PgdA/CDA1 family)
MLRASGLLYLAKRWVRRQGAIVLTFHRVLSDEELEQTASLQGMIVRNCTFADFLEYASKACEFVDLSQLPEWKSSGKLKLAVTFDDGWSDNATAAYPCARQHQTPITIFIVPEKIGTELPFWPERTAAALDRGSSPKGSTGEAMYFERTIEELKKLPTMERDRRIGEMTTSNGRASAVVDKTMTWEQVAELQEGGVTFGSHTSTHEILTSIPVAQANKEITDSRLSIKEKLNTPCLLFSYPNGDWSAPVRDLVARAGYQFAFTNQDPGVWIRECDPLLIPRVNVCEYHLVDAKGNFSPLIFDYAVVWSAAKGLLAQRRTTFLRKIQNKNQDKADNLWKPGEEKPLEKSS